MANMRAVCTVLRRWLTASCRLISHSPRCRSCHQMAACVWSRVRVVLFTAPIVLTSLKSRAYCALGSAGGPEERNIDTLGMRNGLRCPTHADALALVGGVGRHCPGWVPTGQASSPKAPSLRRAEIIAAEVWLPTAVPRVFA